MTADGRAKAAYELWEDEPSMDWERDFVRHVASAIRAAEDEALENAAQGVSAIACQDYCEHDYCVAVHDAASKVRARKSGGAK